ncbi:MAG: sensor histidine kinase [Bullifex sp.]
MSEFYYMRELNVGLLLFACLVNVSLLIGTLSNRKKNCDFMNWFSYLLAAVIIMIAGEAMLWGWVGSASGLLLAKTGAFLSFGSGAAVNTLFVYCLISFVSEREHVSRRFAHIFASVNLVFLMLVILSMFNGMLFTFDEEGWYSDGWAYWIVNLFDVGTQVLELVLVFHYRKILKKNAFYTLLSFSILPFASMLLIPYWTPTPMYLATTLSLIFIQLLFHGEVTRQLAEKELLLAERERQLADSRISMALSQLKPHFLYNVLNSIYYLCGKDPERAQEAVNYFSDYLRNNMSSIEVKKMIPFAEELKHTETYLELEKIRFRTLKVETDIRTSSFMCPPLSLQPLVENAVKHGISKKRGGGTVRISTEETGNAYIIKVRDDGIGFDPEHYRDDGKVHIGMENVRERIERMAGGTLKVTSAPGCGCEAVITLLKKEAEE